MNAEHSPFRHYLDLADARLGSQVVAVSDEWFAPASRMLQAGEPVWKEGVFDDSGKWMDGWETRRKRFEGHDQAVIRLGVPGVLKGVDIDTRFFTGNHPPAASPMAASAPKATRTTARPRAKCWRRWGCRAIAITTTR